MSRVSRSKLLKPFITTAASTIPSSGKPWIYHYLGVGLSDPAI